MCGFAGFISGRISADAPTLRTIAHRMATSLAHRGPDDHGVWLDAELSIALAHRRLSVIDLSHAGHQPMISVNGRYVIAFNGEIYNYRRLGQELHRSGVDFHGTSDTAVLLEAIAHWGIDTTLAKLNGMFAFALWDRQLRRLTLARDRAGKKPLYFGWTRDTFLFASELKAFHCYPDFSAELDRAALAEYLKYGWIPAPLSIYQDIHKLEAGTYVGFDYSSMSLGAVKRYWSAATTAEHGERQVRPDATLAERVSALDELLKNAVSLRMISDVPVGALLSGGIDSSLVVALMRAVSTNPIKTFSIGFSEDGYNEAPFARSIAAHLMTDHRELYVSAKEALDVLPLLPTIYDEPFADPSQIPTYLVSRLARSEVTVALTGDGGDEVFGGYDAYRRFAKRWARRSQNPVRRLAALIGVDKHSQAARRLVAEYAAKRVRNGGRDLLVGAAARTSHLLMHSGRWAHTYDPLQAIMQLDYSSYLVDDVLTKVDRASMSLGLEIRSPLLDYRLLDLAWSLPMEMRIGPNSGKVILQALLERYLPRPLFDRPKSGFGVPIRAWLRGPLRPWAEAMLDRRRLDQQGILRFHAVRRLWDDHVSFRKNNENVLWSILMFQAWHDRWSSAVAVPELSVA